MTLLSENTNTHTHTYTHTHTTVNQITGSIPERATKDGWMAVAWDLHNWRENLV